MRVCICECVYGGGGGVSEACVCEGGGVRGWGWLGVYVWGVCVYVCGVCAHVGVCE